MADSLPKKVELSEIYPVGMPSCGATVVSSSASPFLLFVSSITTDGRDMALDWRLTDLTVEVSFDIAYARITCSSGARRRRR